MSSYQALPQDLEGTSISDLELASINRSTIDVANISIESSKISTGGNNYFIFHVLTDIFLLVLTVVAGTLVYDMNNRLSLTNKELANVHVKLLQLEIISNNNIQSLDYNLKSLQTYTYLFKNDTFEEVSSLHKQLENNNKTFSHYFTDIFIGLNEHSLSLTKLLNGTSNAEVLDQLQATKTIIDHKLVAAKLDMKASLNDTIDSVHSVLAESLSVVSSQIESNNIAILQTQQTVANQLNKTVTSMNEVVNENARNVANQIELTGKELEKTQTQVKLQLNNTVLSMHEVALVTTNKMNIIQQNFTSQIYELNTELATTVDDLNKMVESAKEIINADMQNVKENINKYVEATNKQFAAENNFVKWQLAGTFTLLGCLISLFHLTTHTKHSNKPKIQRRITAVLWMVPIYSFTSWLSLVITDYETMFAAVRECYEAYAVSTFIGMLIAIVADGHSQEIEETQRRGLDDDALVEKKLVVIIKEEQIAKKIAIEMQSKTIPSEHIRPPLTCCHKYANSHEIARAWLFQCRLMVYQFTLLKYVLTAIPFIIIMCGIDYKSLPSPYSEGNFHWNSIKLYIIIIQNISVALAFHGLLTLYHGIEHDLAWCNPWPKFLCIKGVVFATFWQNVVIQLMCSFGLVDEQSASQIQNLLICIEMFVASVLHFYIFPYQEWQEGYKKKGEQKILLRDTLAVMDFMRDLRILTHKQNSISTVSRQSSAANPNNELSIEEHPVGHAHHDHGNGNNIEYVNPLRESLGLKDHVHFQSDHNNISDPRLPLLQHELNQYHTTPNESPLVPIIDNQFSLSVSSKSSDDQHPSNNVDVEEDELALLKVNSDRFFKEGAAILEQVLNSDILADIAKEAGAPSPIVEESPLLLPSLSRRSSHESYISDDSDDNNDKNYYQAKDNLAEDSKESNSSSLNKSGTHETV
eukprot:gene8185-11073_t